MSEGGGKPKPNPLIRSPSAQSCPVLPPLLSALSFSRLSAVHHPGRGNRTCRWFHAGGGEVTWAQMAVYHLFLLHDLLGRLPNMRCFTWQLGRCLPASVLERLQSRFYPGPGLGGVSEHPEVTCKLCQCGQLPQGEAPELSSEPERFWGPFRYWRGRQTKVPGGS